MHAQRKVNGLPTNSWNSTSGWSRIGNTNLEEYAHDMDWMLNESLLCNPKNPCEDKISCFALTQLFMDLWVDIPLLPAFSSIPVPMDMLLYEDPKNQIGLTFDMLDFIENDPPSGDEYDYKSLFLQNMLDSLNAHYSKCDPSVKYSLEFFLFRLYNCHRSRDTGTPPCINRLTCSELGQAFKDFLVDNARPDDPGYSPADLETYAYDLGVLTAEILEYEVPLTQDEQDMSDWFDLFQTYMNEQFNKCYKNTPESTKPMADFLRWSFTCRPGVFPKYKAEPCRTSTLLKTF